MESTPIFSTSNAQDYFYNSKFAERINDQRKKIRFRLPWTYDGNENKSGGAGTDTRSSVAQLRGNADSGTKDAVHPAWRWLKKARNAWMTQNEYPFGKSSADYEENQNPNYEDDGDDGIVEM